MKLFFNYCFNSTENLISSGLILSLKNCHYHHQLQDLIKSTGYLLNSKEKINPNLQYAIIAFRYEAKIYLLNKPIKKRKESVDSSNQLSLSIPGNKCFRSLNCLNNILSNCNAIAEQIRTLTIASQACSKSNRHLKREIDFQLAKIKKDQHIYFDTYPYSSLVNLANKYVLQLLRYLITHDIKYQHSPVLNESHYEEIHLRYANKLIELLLDCKTFKNLIYIKNEIKKMYIVLNINQNSHTGFMTMLKKIESDSLNYIENHTAITQQHDFISFLKTNQTFSSNNDIRNKKNIHSTKVYQAAYFCLQQLYILSKHKDFVEQAKFTLKIYLDPNTKISMDNLVDTLSILLAERKNLFKNNFTASTLFLFSKDKDVEFLENFIHKLNKTLPTTYTNHYSSLRII